MRKIEFWCAKHTKTNAIDRIMVAGIERLTGGALFEVRLKKIFYQKGYDDWKVGNITALAESDLKEPKEVIQFMFEEI